MDFPLGMFVEELKSLYPILWAANKRFSSSLSIDAMRKVANDLYDRQWEVPGDITCRVEDSGGIKGLWSETSDAHSDRVILYFHGGGYVLGNPKTWLMISSELGRAAKMKTFSPAYRLAPENPYPAAVEDGLAAYRWLLLQGFSPSSIIISGDSAGAALALTTMLQARDAGLPLPSAAFLMSPWIDLEMTGDTMVLKQDTDPLANLQWLQGFADLYLQGHSPRDPLVSPVHASLHGLPPMLIHLGSNEVMLDSVFRFCRQASLAEVQTRLVAWPNCFHVFHMWHTKLSAARQAISEFADFARHALIGFNP